MEKMRLRCGCMHHLQCQPTQLFLVIVGETGLVSGQFTLSKVKRVTLVLWAHKATLVLRVIQALLVPKVSQALLVPKASKVL
jgi:hypothetical protein